jgi:hypothetical protein
MLGACLVMRAASAADQSLPFPMATLGLRDGRVLHNVRVISNGPDNIVVRADEGLIKVAKSNLPQAAADAYPVRPELPQAAPQQVVGPKPVPKPTQNQKPALNPVFKGCVLVSFQMKPYHNSLGCAEVVIRNDSGAAVVIFPRDIVCVMTAGTRYAGRQFVAADASPPIVKRREIVPTHGSASDLLTFVNDAIDISSVQWAK